MKKLLALFSLIIATFLFAGKASAQQSLTVLGTYGATNQSYISKGTYGGGLQYRRNIKPNIVVGLTAKYLIEDLDRELSAKTIRGRGTNVPVNLLGEYYFQTTGIRTYVGVEAGLNILKIEGYNIVMDQTTVRPGVAPKVGIVLPMGKRLSFIAEASYGVIFGSKNYLLMDPLKAGNEKYEVKNSNQSITINGGITYIFGKKKQ